MYVTFNGGGLRGACVSMLDANITEEGSRIDLQLDHGASTSENDTFLSGESTIFCSTCAAWVGGGERWWTVAIPARVACIYIP